MLICSTVSSSHAGFIALLRGDGPQATAQAAEARRVAFVGEANVRKTEGTVTVLRGVERWETLSTGVKLLPGDLLQTGSSGRVLLKMQSGAFVSVAPNTILRLVPFDNGMDPAVISGNEKEKGFTVRAVRGTAWTQTAQKEWQPLMVNGIVPEGAMVKTGKDGCVDLFERSSGKFVRVQGQGELKLQSASIVQRTIHPQAPVLAANVPAPSNGALVGR